MLDTEKNCQNKGEYCHFMHDSEYQISEQDSCITHK